MGLEGSFSQCQPPLSFTLVEGAFRLRRNTFSAHRRRRLPHALQFGKIRISIPPFLPPSFAASLLSGIHPSHPAPLLRYPPHIPSPFLSCIPSPFLSCIPPPHHSYRKSSTSKPPRRIFATNDSLNPTKSRKATIHRNHRPGHESGLISTQPFQYPHQFLRLSKPSHRGLRNNGLPPCSQAAIIFHQ